MRISDISLTFVLGVFLSAIPFLHLKGASAPGWVKQAIEKSDAIEIAKDAPAFIICNDYDVYISSHNKSKTRVHYAVKIITGH
ncbi:MAG: hypothetical protein GF404_08815 [candidate division Zixibacteria bacterium]|nr:hypothetical protein [candidate division Zixibacteria bacterium]